MRSSKRYLAAVAHWPSQSLPGCAEDAAQIMDIEAEHQALGGVSSGSNPPDNLIAEAAPFASVSQAVPALVPFVHSEPHSPRSGRLSHGGFYAAVSGGGGRAGPNRARTAAAGGGYSSSPNPNRRGRLRIYTPEGCRVVQQGGPYPRPGSPASTTSRSARKSVIAGRAETGAWPFWLAAPGQLSLGGELELAQRWGPQWLSHLGPRLPAEHHAQRRANRAPLLA
jgi:hypothetical protein